MAIRACDRLVRAVQIVVRVPIMIEQGFRPVRVVMAGVAGIAVMPAMFIIFYVTKHAGLVHFILPRIFRVAVNADQFRVLALE
jgi:hypothetical protein